MNLPKLNPRKTATVLFDEYHSESWTVSEQKATEMQPDRPGNSSYKIAAEELEGREYIVERNIDSEIDSKVLQGKNLLVFLHPCEKDWEVTTSSNSPKLSASEIKTIQDFVRNGGGLFVITEYENAKYGNNLNELVTEFGITIENSTVRDLVAGTNAEKTHVLAALEKSKDNNLLIGVNKACFYRAGSCKTNGNAKIIVTASDEARPKNAGFIAVSCVAVRDGLRAAKKRNTHYHLYWC